MKLPEHIDWSLDRDAVGAHFAALTREDLRMRFAGDISSERLAEYLHELATTRAPAFGVFADDGRIAAFAHCAVAGKTLELGLSVLPGFRRRGYAALLLRRAQTYARTHGLDLLVMHSLATNHPIIQLARAFGMRVETCEGETDSTIRLTAPTADDLWQEQAFEQASLLQQRLRHAAG